MSTANIMKTRQFGFTLIELMITVAIIGILAAIGYPSYKNAMVKNRRAAAQSFLSDVAQRQAQFLIDSRSYTTALTGTGSLNAPTPADVSVYYEVSIAVGSSTVPSFTATAAPITGLSQVADGALSINSAGVKSPAGKW